MNLVLVKFDGCKKEYCFEVPDNLLKYVESGVKVLVETQFGRRPAVTSSDVITGPGAKDVAEKYGAKFPLSKIAAIESEVYVCTIVIPNHLKFSVPGGGKIEKRMQELKDYGEFKTNVVVGADHVLRDGYTAYLAASAWRTGTIKAFVMG